MDACKRCVFLCVLVEVIFTTSMTLSVCQQDLPAPEDSQLLTPQYAQAFDRLIVLSRFHASTFPAVLASKVCPPTRQHTHTHTHTLPTSIPIHASTHACQCRPNARATVSRPWFLPTGCRQTLGLMALIAL